MNTGHGSLTPQRTVPAAAGNTEQRTIVIERWGRVSYADAWTRQLALHAARVRDEVPDTLIVVEHPPTITLGRHAATQDILTDGIELARRGVEVVRTDRGGRATYHGPGQVVVYPIVSIEALGVGVKSWVRLLEDAIIDTLNDYGIDGRRRPATAGIWTASGKIASIGLRIVRGVSYHGLALNIGLDASAFDDIVTCGVRDERVTTIAAQTRCEPVGDEVSERLTAHIIERMRERQRDVHQFP